MKLSRPIVVVLILVTGAVAAFCVAAVLIASSYRRTHPDVVIPLENRHSFARVAILLDGTRSVGGPQAFELIKEIVRKKIIPSLGVNDVAMCYDVQPVFDPTVSAVFGLTGDQPPQDSEDRRARILEVLDKNRESSQHGVVDDEVYKLIGSLGPQRQRTEEVRRIWEQRVEARRQAEPLGSDICGPLKDLAHFLKRGDGNTERWLFVLSDLKQDTRARSCRAAESFPDARVVLIYPPEDSDSEQWESLEAFWRPVFEDRELERISFAAALTDGALLPPNPTAGLEKYDREPER